VFLDDHQEYVYGDAFIITKYGAASEYYKEGSSCPKKHWLIIRVCARAQEPMDTKLHITVGQVDHWFDERVTSVQQNSTILVAFDDWSWLGYSGKHLTEVFKQSDNQIPT